MGLILSDDFFSRPELTCSIKVKAPGHHRCRGPQIYVICRRVAVLLARPVAGLVAGGLPVRAVRVVLGEPVVVVLPALVLAARSIRARFDARRHVLPVEHC